MKNQTPCARLYGTVRLADNANNPQRLDSFRPAFHVFDWLRNFRRKAWSLNIRGTEQAVILRDLLQPALQDYLSRLPII